uniref:histidine kinase n=1 Tax=Oscillatoriales cyanobacterium SpSt-402 TaxID=2282168 RepID=A0A832M3Y7_9CYAN
MRIAFPLTLRRLVTTVPLRGVMVLPFVLPTVIPNSHFWGAIQANTPTTTLVGLLTFGGAFALGWLAAIQLTARSTQLNRTTRKRAVDHLKQRLPTNRLIRERSQLEAERKQAEDHLRKTEQWLHHYSQLSPGNIYTLVEEPDGTIWFEYMSSAVETIHEYTAEQVLQDAYLLLDAIHPDDRAGYQQAVLESKQTLNSFVHQWRVVTPSGKVKWLQGNSQPERRENGVVAWHGVVVDISDRKQVEDALRQSEILNRTILNALPDLIIRMHQDGTYLDIKPTTAFPIEFPNFKLGENIRNFLPSEAAEQRLDAAAKALHTGTIQVYEFPLVVQGQQLWQEARVVPLNAEEVIVVVRDLTPRKQIEEALRQSEARLALSQQVAQVGYWEFDLEKQASTWSEITFHHWGVDPTQPEPSFAELLKRVHPNDLAYFQQNVEAAMTAGTPYHLDLRVIHPDGSIRYLDSRGESLLNSQGQVLKLIGTSMDITERKKAESALQESETRFRQLAETVREGFFVFETTTSQYSYLNSACINISGIPTNPSQTDQEYFRGMTHWFQNIHPDDRDRIERALQQERQGSNFNEEYRFIRPDGEIRWLKSQAFPIQDEANTIVRIVGTVEDITERKQIEEALRDSEERFRRAFDDAPIGISLVCPTGQFLKVNAHYCSLLGYTEEELLALTFQEITHSADLKTDEEGFRQLLSGEIRSFQMEKRYITKQGMTIPVLMNVAPIRDHDGRVIYCVGHIQDIRDRLRVEQMKEEFISVVSHELRTPLTSIRGALGILETGVFSDRPDKAKHMLQIAINNSDRLVRLVDEILSLERLDSGKVQLVIEQCQVADLMQQAIDGIQAIADQAAVTLSLTPLSATLWAAPDALVQTLTNLLSNAIKFSSPGNTVWLKAEIGNQESGIGNREKKLSLTPPPLHSSPPSPFLLFSVKDQGRGIPAEKLDIIFEKFQQVDVSDCRKKAGTGLGLAICKNIVQQHGGQIWVESTVGQGSTFYFTIPLDNRNRLTKTNDQ